MTTDDFNVILQNRINKIREILQSKGNNYTPSDGDRLGAFKHGAVKTQLTPHHYLLCLMDKHMQVIYDDIINDEPKIFTSEWIDERIGDCINYLILLEALLRDK